MLCNLLLYFSMWSNRSPGLCGSLSLCVRQLWTWHRICLRSGLRLEFHRLQNLILVLLLVCSFYSRLELCQLCKQPISLVLALLLQLGVLRDHLLCRRLYLLRLSSRLCSRSTL